jgi:uncharacterized membrane protein YgaE (UPF0421/DUF939 family)
MCSILPTTTDSGASGSAHDGHDGRVDTAGFSGRQAINRMALRAFDLSERTARAGRLNARRRLERWRGRWFLILQCSVTAALAWALARVVLDHPAPFFAPLAAILTLGGTYGQRMRRGIEVATGVAVGVAIGDLWVLLFGTGTWQVGAVCAIAMSLATLLGAGQLMITQAGVQAIFVISFGVTEGHGVGRWLDAVMGCGMALLVATIAPSTPLRRPGLIAAKVLRDMATTLQAAGNALRAGDTAAAAVVLEQARASERDLAALSTAASEGISVIRQSPFRRRQLSALTALADVHVPLDHASRNLRVLARRCAVAAWRHEEVPPEYVGIMERLSEICRTMAEDLAQQRIPVGARADLIAVAEASAHLPLVQRMSAVVVLAQIRSIITDLLELTGMDYADARELIPEMD